MMEVNLPRMDETIADFCLRQLHWDQEDLWRSDHTQNTYNRIACVYKKARPLILKVIKSDKSPLKNMKKVGISKSMRDNGKKALENKKPLDALNMYNKAVMFAPNQDDHLALALSERTAVLITLEDWELGLRDIELAIARGYPFESLYELEERRAHCYVGLKKFGLARKSFHEAISQLEDAAAFLSKKLVERKMQEIQMALRSIQNSNDHCVEYRDNCKFSNMKNLPDMKRRNSRYPAFSEKIDVVHRDKGRTVMSNKSINTGEIIGIEKPVVSFLEKDFMKTNCWHCLVTLKAPLACPLCSNVNFCGRECLQEALSTYHPSECLITDLLLQYSPGPWHLAYRAVSSRRLEELLEEKVNLARSQCNGTNGSVYKSSDLANFFNLPTHHTLWPPDQIKRRTIMSVFYLILLQTTGYFDKSISNGRTNPSMSSINQMKGQENDDTLSEDEMFVAILLDHLMEATAFSTNEVCHFEMDEVREWTTGKVTSVIGKTINPTLALVNHSCCPNTARICFQNNTLLVAQKAILPGEEVTLNYALPFYAAPLKDRKEFLQKGFVFNCECEACCQDWPLFDSLPASIPGSEPWVDQTKPNGVQSFNSFGLSKTEQNVLEVFNRVKDSIETLQKMRVPGSPPNKSLIQNQVRLYRCLLAMYSSKICTIKLGQHTSMSIPI